MRSPGNVQAADQVDGPQSDSSTGTLSVEDDIPEIKALLAAADQADRVLREHDADTLRDYDAGPDSLRKSEAFWTARLAGTLQEFIRSVRSIAKQISDEVAAS